MTTTSGPQNLPIPQTTDAPDGPGAFLALAQKFIVGGPIPFDTYANMVAALGNGFNGQVSAVTSDSSAWLNGIYMSNGSGWELIGGKRITRVLTMNSPNFTAGLGQITQRGGVMSFQFQYTKSSAIAVNDLVGTLPIGARPPTVVPLGGMSTTGANLGPVTYQVATTGAITVNSIAAAAAGTAWITGSFETV